VKDELHKQIIEGLSGELHGNIFEAAAVDLLQPIYPSLTPVKGGGDGGRDGHFFTINGAAGVLVCTTGEDVGGNLRHNLQEYVKKGHKGRSVIVATSQSLTILRQDNLTAVAKEEGFKLIKVHEQSDFTLRLYKNKAWLKKLLNLESNQQALSINPMTSRPVLSLSVRGREDVLEWLGRTTGDSLLVGQPGSGKTFVARHFIMENGGLFVVSDNRDQITAEVREKKPDYLVIDDAHTKPEMIQVLRQIREDTGAGFKIIATGWLSNKDSLQNDLVIADNAIFEVELQGRDTILAIIKDCGVTSPDALLYQMITQAEGKPGLAATLSQLVLSGDAKGVQEVYIGDALGKHLLALFEKQLGSDAVDLLAVVAMGGDAGITLKDAADILGTTEIKVGNLAAKLSFGGVIVDLPPDAISVRPAPLRFYLAKKVFFKPGAAIDPTKHLSKYKSLNDVVEVVLNAGLRGGAVDKDALYVLIEKTGLPKLFGGFAVFGKTEAKKVLLEHPDMALKAIHDLLSVYPEGILPLMLDAAVGDTRPLNSHPDHPFRVIQDWCKNVGEGYYDPLPRRKILMKVLADWKTAGKDLLVFAQALDYAFEPHFEIHRNDPGAGNSISFGGGHLSATGMQQLLDQWPTFKPLLSDLPDEAWHYLVDLLEEWAYEQRAMGGTPNKEQKEALHKGAAMIIDDLAELSVDQLGIQARLRELAHHLKHKVETTRAREYDIIFPHEDDRRDWQKMTAKQVEAAKTLATEYVSKDPGDVIALLVNMNKHAAAAHKTYPDHTTTVAYELADKVADLTAWSEAAITEWDRPDISLAFLLVLQARDPEAAKPLLLKALKDDRHRYAAVEVILRRNFADDELWKEAYPLLKDMSRTADILVLRQQTDEETTARLLQYPTGDVGLMVADTIAHLSGDTIPAAVLPLWEAAIINYKFERDTRHNDMHVSNALKSHPATTVKWLIAKVAEEHDGWLDGFRRESSDLMSTLSREQRVQVVRSLSDSERSEHVAAELVGKSLSMFKELLANKNTRRYQLGVLSHVDGAEWVQFAELALEAGWDEDDIISASTSMSDSWSGSAAQHWLLRKARFDEGFQSGNPRIVTIAQKGIAHYQSLYDYAVINEKKDDIYGY